MNHYDFRIVTFVNAITSTDVTIGRQSDETLQQAADRLRNQDGPKLQVRDSCGTWRDVPQVTIIREKQ